MLHLSGSDLESMSEFYDNFVLRAVTLLEGGSLAMHTHGPGLGGNYSHYRPSRVRGAVEPHTAPPGAGSAYASQRWDFQSDHGQY